jgi:hypothetical protein
MAREKGSPRLYAARIAMKHRRLSEAAPVPLVPERYPASPPPHDQMQVLMNMKRLPVELITEVGNFQIYVLMFLLITSRYAATYTPKHCCRCPALASDSTRS